MYMLDNMLTSIELRGFKSIPFQYPLFLELRNVNILLGANGAGKSIIVGFFKMLGAMMEGKLQRFIAEAGTNQKFLYYGVKSTPEIKARLGLKTYKFIGEYGVTLRKAVPDRLIVVAEEIACENVDGDAEIREMIREDYNESALLRSSDSMDMAVRKLLASCKVYQFSDSSLSSPMRLAGSVNTAHYLQSDGGNLASFLYYLKHEYPESFLRITDFVRDVVPQFQNFYLEPERGYISLKWSDISVNDYVLSADQLSDGSIRFIALATLLLQPNDTMPAVIIIDEPELGLHPYAIDQLNEMIKDASVHAQIIVATQSPAILDGFSADDVIVIERDAEIHGTSARRLTESEYHDND